MTSSSRSLHQIQNYWSSRSHNLIISGARVLSVERVTVWIGSPLRVRLWRRCDNLYLWSKKLLEIFRFEFAAPASQLSCAKLDRVISGNRSVDQNCTLFNLVDITKGLSQTLGINICAKSKLRIIGEGNLFIKSDGYSLLQK